MQHSESVCRAHVSVCMSVCVIDGEGCRLFASKALGQPMLLCI